jgi:uncharacterized protein YciI
MKKIILLVIVLLSIASTSNAQVITAGRPTRDNEKVDEGEMKTYVMVFLKEGPNRKQSTTEVEKIQKEHLEHLTRMYQEGMLIMAGPFLDESKIKGILIMSQDQIEEAKARVEEDPAIKAGRLIAEYHLWYTKSGAVTLP